MSNNAILTCSCSKQWATNLEALRIFGVRQPMCTCGQPLDLRAAKEQSA